MEYLVAFIALILTLGCAEALVKHVTKKPRLGCFGTVVVVILGSYPGFALAMLGYNTTSGTHGVWMSRRGHLDIRYGGSDFYRVNVGGKRQSNLQLRNTPRTLMLLQNNQPIAEGTLNWSATKLTLRPLGPNSIVSQTTTLGRMYLEH
ncbi:hypothetical protein [Armatimonas sp.]|uniref:hypothetical protein n=1 Tax=Armatimonas sp. TaxID=1872638 RepID=UPI003751C6BD